MGKSTLTVPAGYVDFTRTAAMSEVEFDSKWVEQTLAEAEEDSGALVDVRAAEDNLAEARSIAAQLLTAPDEQEIELHGEAPGLAHLAETIAREVVAPRLGDVVGISPMEAEEAAEVTALTDALSWAGDQAARLHKAS